jgi:hypothetical protein
LGHKCVSKERLIVKSHERHGGHFGERGWCSCLLKVPVMYTTLFNFFNFQQTGRELSPCRGTEQSKLFGILRHNESKAKYTCTNRLVKTIGVYITCFCAVEFWTGFMIKIPRLGSILNGLGSTFHTTGLNIQRWKMSPRVNFQPGS